MTCPHHELDVVMNLIRIIADKDKDKPFPPVAQMILEVSPRCKACGLAFVVDWQDIADPNHPPSFMDRRPWTTPNRDTLCVKISPSQAHPQDNDFQETGGFYTEPHTSGKPN